MLVVRGLWKNYGGVEVLRDVSLTLTPNSIAVVTGANGSGKTTLVRIIAGLLQPSRGYISVYGFKPGSINARRITSVILDKPLLYEELTVRENLELFKKLNGLRVSPYYSLALENLGVVRVLDRRVGELSHGWRRRVDFVRSLIGESKLLLFDELPTAFDVDGLREIASILALMARSGSIVLVTSPSLEQAKLVAEYATTTCRLEAGELQCV